MINVQEAVTLPNIAEYLDQDVLDSIGRELWEAVDADDHSRQQWIQDQGEAIKLAAQVRETKSFPWPNASNVKYPLLTLAAVHFHARALPGLINSERPVQAKVTGRFSPEKQGRATRVSTYMSYDLQTISSEWMDVMDRLLLVLPITGLAFKKSFFSELKGRIVTELVLPVELILNYHATCYDRARMTHVRYMDENEFVEHVRMGLFLDTDFQDMTDGEPLQGERDSVIGLNPNDDRKEDYYKLYEVHCWYDLDGDGYKEPYIITIDEESKKVARIVARWKEDDVEYNEEGQVARITPEDYFTPYMLIPDPNSSVYGIGFGTLLGSTNESVNTLINQLIDAGSLANLQSGFLGRGIKLRGGATRFKPGEWKLVNSTGDDIRKAVFPMPVRDPSPTLLSLLQLLLDSGQQITSVSDMMMGENPGQNQKATTTMAVLEQGLSVFKGIYRRIHRSLTKELIRMCDLNYRFLDEERYLNVLDEKMPEQVPGPEGPIPQDPNAGSLEDFNLDDLDIFPTADPSIITDAQKLAKAQSLLEKVGAGLPLNVQVVLMKVLEAEGHTDIPELMQLPPPRPSMEEKELELEITKAMTEALESKTRAIKNIADAEATEAGTQIQQYQAIVSDIATTIGLENDAEDRKIARAQGNAPAGKSKPTSGGTK